MRTQRYCACQEMFRLKEEGESQSITRTYLQNFHLFASPRPSQVTVLSCSVSCWLQAATPGHGTLPQSTHQEHLLVCGIRLLTRLVTTPGPVFPILQNSARSPGRQVSVGSLILMHKTVSTCCRQSLLALLGTFAVLSHRCQLGFPGGCVTAFGLQDVCWIKTSERRARE